jgi:hypothetical protein
VDTTKLRIIDVLCGSIIVLFQTFNDTVSQIIEQTVESEAFELEIEGVILSASAFNAFGMFSCPCVSRAHPAWFILIIIQTAWRASRDPIVTSRVCDC